MTDRRNAVDPAEVRRALRSLATGEAQESVGGTLRESATAPSADETETERESDDADVERRERSDEPTKERVAPERTVQEAAEALADVRAAAEFVDDDGLCRLRRAVEVAERAGDRETARRGERSLATVERYRAVASGGEAAGGSGSAVDGAGSPFLIDRADNARRADRTDSRRGDDYFHSSRGTVLRAGSQETGE